LSGKVKFLVKSKWVILMLMMVFALVMVAGCGQKPPAEEQGPQDQGQTPQGEETSSEPIKVGLILPLTGTQAMFGQMEKNSFEMAYAELEAQGKTTVNGRRIELIFEDDQSKQDVGKAAAEKLINQNNVNMLSGGYSSAVTNVIAGTAQSNQIPFMIVTGSADKITQQGWEWIFRGSASPASKYTASFWKMMDEVIKAKTAGVIYENTDFGISSAEGFKEAATEHGIEVVFDQSYEAGALDFKPMLAKMQAEEPDIIFAVSYVMDAALITKQMKELNFSVDLFVGGGAGYTMPEFVENAGDASQYVASTTLWVPNVAWKGAADYFKNYQEKYDKQPDYHGAQAYASMYVIADVLNRAEEYTREGIKKALEETDLDTIMGSVKFEDWEGYTNQDRPTTYVVQWIDGQLEVVWPEEAKSADYVFPVPKWSER